MGTRIWNLIREHKLVFAGLILGVFFLIVMSSLFYGKHLRRVLNDSLSQLGSYPSTSKGEGEVTSSEPETYERIFSEEVIDKAPETYERSTSEEVTGPKYGSSGPPTSTQIVDEIVEKLEWGNIVFNAPQKMQFDSPEQIELLLSLKKTVQELQTELNRHPEIESDRVRISNRMEARLSGKGFKIEALVPELQAVSGEETTKWKWEVIPTDYGSQRLHLTLTAIISISDKEAPRVIRTFDKNIEVEITLGQRIAGFIMNNWKWLWAAILVPIITFLWKFFGKTKRNYTK